MLSSSGAMSVGNSGSFFCFCPSEDKVDVVIAPTALHLGHVKAPLEGLGMQVRLCIALDGHGVLTAFCLCSLDLLCNFQAKS